MQLPDPFADRYTNLRFVGRGGFGVVYRATDQEMERDVALKLLNPELAADGDWKKRFRQEATAASRLWPPHPNITLVFDRGEYQNQPFIVMEFVEGETLSRIIDRRVPLTDPERLFLLEQLCDGLHYAHQKNIIHRDIKPVNLIVREDHDGTQLVRTLKILDFGIAKLVSTERTLSTGTIAFTPEYVSPEQIRGERADRRSDMFSVGAVAYELLVMEKAFVITSTNRDNVFLFLDEVKRKIVEEPHRPMTAIRPDIDRELCEVVDRALAKRPDDRFRDLAEMRRQLHRISERLKEAEPKPKDGTTIFLNLRQQALVTAARKALETDDPTMAIARFQEALSAGANAEVRRLIEPELEEARGRQRAKRADAAHEAIASARVAFQRGDLTAAIRVLEEFKPADLVAETRDEIMLAAALVRRAEQVVEAGTVAQRDAVLQELDRFSPPELVRGAVARIRARVQALEKAAGERADAAVASARALFAEGRRDEAIASLERFADPGRVTGALEGLREAVRAIDEASNAVQYAPDAGDRGLALGSLEAFGDQELVARPLADLRRLARELDEAENQQRAALAARAAAETQFDAGDRTGAIARLEKFAPAHEVVTAALAELRERARRLDEEERLTRQAAAEKQAAIERQALERRAAKAVEQANKLFASGARADAIELLRRFEAPELVAAAREQLEQLAARIARAEEQVRTGTAEAGRAAIDDLGWEDATELTKVPLDVLRELYSQRRAEERRREEELARARREKEARDVEGRVRELIGQGAAADALSVLKTYRASLPPGEPGPMAARLKTLESDAEAIDAARQLVEQEAAPDRRTAIDRLAKRTPRELFAQAVAELRRIDERRTAEEQQKDAARVAALAEQAVLAAREQFGRGEHEAAIRVLESYRPKHPTVAAALDELRADYQRILTLRREEEEERRRVEELARAGREKEAREVESRVRELTGQGAVADALSVLNTYRASLPPGEPGPLAAQLKALEADAEAIDATLREVEQASAPIRRNTIDRLAKRTPRELFEHTVAELRRIDERRTAEEQKQEAERLATAAERAVAAARQQFARGEHEVALRALESFTPAHATVTDALEELRADYQGILTRRREKDDEERRQAEELARARREEEAREVESRVQELIEQGAAAEALSVLSTYRAALSPGEPGPMAAQLKALEADAEAIEASRQLVEQGASSIRRTTIERLAKRKPQERFEQAVAQLRRIDERRTAEEQQAEAARIAAAAERAVLAARQQFARGDHEASISALEAYRPIHPTTTKALEELRLDLERILAQRAREEEERKRREAEEAARRAEEEKERKRIEAERAATVREVAALIGKADVATADKHFDQSAALLDQALALLPESADLAVARTRLARAIEAEETRKKREQIDRLLPAIGAAIDAGSFEPARKQLSDVAALGATAAEVTPLRQRLEDAVAQHGEMTSGLTALTNALDTAAASNNAAARIVVLDKALATTVNREPTARAALKLWPGYQDAVRRARDLREQASVLEAQRAIEETLAKRSRTGRLPSKALRKADRALRQAEIDFPNAPVWPSLREQMEALRSARAAEPTFVDTTLQRIRRIPSRAALALAVVLLAAVGVGVWRTWPSPPTPPGKEESLPTPPAGPSLLDRARAALAAGRPDEALDLGLQALDADSRDPGTIQFLTDLRSAAATAAAVARDKAAGAGASSRPDFTTAQQKLMDALALMAPRQTGDAIRMFGEAADLYRSAEAGASTPAEILALAQGESREGRTDGAVSYALRGLKQYPGDSGLTGFLGSLRRAASDKVGSARDAARKAGAGLPEGGAVAIKTYQSGVGQESVAARLGTQQTAEALTALKDAEALYRKAEQEAGNFKIAEANRRLAEATKLGAEIEQSLNSAANDLKAGKFDEAAKTVAGVLQKDPKNLRAQGLQQQISEARERDRVAANSAESRQRAIGLVNQARLTRGQRGIDLLREAQDADPTNADIGPLRQELQAEVAKPKTPAPPPVNDEELIRQALLQYAAAMRSMNPDNVLAITTAHTRAFLERQFKSVDAFIFQLPPNARITRDGNSARVQFAAPLQTGGGRQNNVTFEFVLARSGNIWRIESVTFR